MHQPLDDEVDVWMFHDRGDFRNVTNVTSFAYYALSPKTREVVFTQESPLSGEIKAYGPEEQFVWYDIPHKLDQSTGSLVSGLLKELSKTDTFHITPAGKSK